MVDQLAHADVRYIAASIYIRHKKVEEAVETVVDFAVSSELAERYLTGLGWSMVHGARPAIHMRPVDRQPYLIAHELAHVDTRTVRHPPTFVRVYLDGLELLGGNRAELENGLRRFGVKS